jgi:hypothetical protein
MTMLGQPKGTSPCRIDDDLLIWSIPTHVWSLEQYGEDTLEVRYYFADDEWQAHTEMDQNVKRDIPDEQIASIRAEFGLDAWVEYYRPRPSPGFRA